MHDQGCNIHIHPGFDVKGQLDRIESTLHDLKHFSAAAHRAEMLLIDIETNSLAVTLQEIANALGPEKQAEIDKLNAASARLNSLAKTSPETPIPGA